MVSHSATRSVARRLPQSNVLASAGRFIFAAGVAGLGLQTFFTAAIVGGLEPLPKSLAGQPLAAYGTGVLLIALAALAIVPRLKRAGAVALAVVLWTCVLGLQLPQVFAAPHDGGVWTSFLEAGAFAGAATVLLNDAFIAPGRTLFAATLVGFGVLHFVYHNYVASVIPTWLPWHQGWAYATGIAFFLAACSIIVRVFAKNAATLVGIMFGSWVAILHLPRVLASLHSQDEWTSLIIAVIMCGGALIVAKSYGERAAL